MSNETTTASAPSRRPALGKWQHQRGPQQGVYYVRRASGRSCTYEYVEYAENEKHRVKRTKPGPRTTSQLLARESQNTIPSSPGTRIGLTYSLSISQESALLSNSTSPVTRNNEASSSLYSALPQYDDDCLFWPSVSDTLPQLFPDSSTLFTYPNSAPLTGIIPAVSSFAQEESIIYQAEDDGDPEGVRSFLCRSLTVDKNLKENALPFVLHCYSQWALVRIFEPAQAARTVREQVIAHFATENMRTRTILIANVMDVFARNLAIDRTRKVILDRLISGISESGFSFATSRPPSIPALDRRNATRTLDNILEIFSLQLTTYSMPACIQSMDYAAPVFRRACLDPPGKPVNLARILLESDLNLRHFATLDIVQSITTGQPTHFRYEVQFTLELCERVYMLQSTYGLQWLHGFPDQFILLFAWIISLCETPGASNDTGLIAWLETHIPLIRINLDESGDPALRIGRVAVQECWRFAVLIYFYMALCKANAYDPRVIRVQGRFMRLVRRLRPGRNPDAYLLAPVTITSEVGVATVEDRDRDMLRRRMLSIEEYSVRGTVGNDVILYLEEIWATTREEGRPAVWSDLGKAYLKLSGK